MLALTATVGSLIPLVASMRTVTTKEIQRSLPPEEYSLWLGAPRQIAAKRRGSKKGFEFSESTVAEPLFTNEVLQS